MLLFRIFFAPFFLSDGFIRPVITHYTDIGKFYNFPNPFRELLVVLANAKQLKETPTPQPPPTRGGGVPFQKKEKTLHAVSGMVAVQSFEQ
jgi:hypothetical protein